MKTEEEKIKIILEKKIFLLGELESQIKQQRKAIDENDLSSLVEVLEAKESVIASLVKDDEEFDECVMRLNNADRKIIVKKFKEYGARIETETKKIIV